MASIIISDRTNSGCDLYLSSLDTSWGGGTRTCKWYFKSGSYPTESSYTKKVTSYIYGSPSSGGDASVSGLTANTTYYCSCYVYSGSTLLTTLHKTFTTYPNVTLSSLTVTQTAIGTKKATVTWSGSNISGGYYYLYVDGSLKAEGSITSNTMSKTVTFNSFDTYTIEVSGDNYGQDFYKSRNVTISDYDLTPIYGGCTKDYRSLRFDWSGASDAAGFTVTLDYWGGTWSEVNTTLRYKTFSNLDFGTSYYIYVQAYNDSKTGSREFGYTATTIPAPPTISLSQNNGYITVSYGVVASSNISSFTFYLYNSSGSRIETKTISNSSSQNPSGSFTFGTCLTDGMYTVKGFTTYNGQNSITSAGDTYTTQSILVSLRPDNWYWSGVVSGTRTDNLSYTTWNSFIERIREWLEYKNLANSSPGTSVYGSVSTMSYLLDLAKMNSTTSGKILTANRFNIARYCIGSMNATGIVDKSPGDIVYASYFTTLATKMNNIPTN